MEHLKGDRNIVFIAKINQKHQDGLVGVESEKFQVIHNPVSMVNEILLIPLHKKVSV
jgi:hypothetical protein